MGLALWVLPRRSSLMASVSPNGQPYVDGTPTGCSTSTGFASTSRLGAWLVTARMATKATARIAIPTTPSSHQWLAVAVTTKTVMAKWPGPNQRQRLLLTFRAYAATIAAQATWMDGIAPTCPAMPSVVPYIDWPYLMAESTNPRSPNIRGGATGIICTSTQTKVVTAKVLRASG